jgi:hypothetical protein
MFAPVRRSMVTAALFVLLAGVCAPAFAAPMPVSFTFANETRGSTTLTRNFPIPTTPTNQTASSFTGTVSGITLSVDATGGTGNVTARAGGLGVQGMGANLDVGESLDFDFDNNMGDFRLDSILFRNIAGNTDTFNIFVDGNLVGTAVVPSSNSSFFTFTPPPNTVGDEVVITGVSSVGEGNAGSFVAQITVTPVPEPATLAVFGLVSAGAWAVRRKRGAA